MARLFFFLLISSCFVSANAQSFIAVDDTSTDYRGSSYEEKVYLSVGAGFMRTFDRDVLNNPDRVRLNPEFNFHISLEGTVGEMLNTGIYAEICGQSFDSIEHVDYNGKYVIDNTPYLNAVVGVYGKLHLRQTFIRPYVIGLVGFQNGLLMLNGYTKYNKGLLLGAGAGLSTTLFDKIRISGEYRFCLGFSFWDDPPVFNSDGVYFNPNHAIGLITVGYRIR